MAKGNHNDPAIVIRLLEQLAIADPTRGGDLVVTIVAGMEGQ